MSHRAHRSGHQSPHSRLQQRVAVCELAEDEALRPLWSAADDRGRFFEA